MPDNDMCTKIAVAPGVVLSSAVPDWAPLDTVTNPGILPADPFNDLQDPLDPTMSADLGLLPDSDLDLGKSVVSDPGLPEDSNNIFMGAPYNSANILNNDFTNDLNFDDSDPTQFVPEQISGNCGSVSSYSSVFCLQDLSITVLYLFFCFRDGRKGRGKVLIETVCDLTKIFRTVVLAKVANNVFPKAGHSRDSSSASRSVIAQARSVHAPNSSRMNSSTPCSRAGKSRSGIKIPFEIPFLAQSE